MTVTKNFISDDAGILDLPGDINCPFILITMLTFRAYKKKLPVFLFFWEGLFISDIFFFWKVDKEQILEVLSFNISRHHFPQIFRTSFNIIWKNDFRHERWESDKDWFWPFEPIWKLKTTFSKYWTSIKVQLWVQLNMKFLLGYDMKIAI